MVLSKKKFFFWFGVPLLVIIIVFIFFVLFITFFESSPYQVDVIAEIVNDDPLTIKLLKVKYNIKVDSFWEGQRLVFGDDFFGNRDQLNQYEVGTIIEGGMNRDICAGEPIEIGGRLIEEGHPCIHYYLIKK